MGGTSVLLMVLTILTKFFGLAREKALAHFFGTSPMASIFLVAFSLPMVVSNLFAGSIASGYIPIFNQVKEKMGEDKANDFTSNLINAIAILSAILSLISIVFAKEIVSLLSPGFKGIILERAIYMSRITAISVLVTAIASIFKAYLQIKGNFFVSLSHSVFMNIFLIIAMYLGSDQNPTILAVGILLAFIFQYIVFIPFIKKQAFSYRRILDPRDPNIKSLLLLIVPIIISTSVLEVNLLVNKALASQISLSGLSIINYASKIQGFITGIVVTSIITVSFPQMSRLVEEEKEGKLSDIFADSLSLMSLFVIPASLGVMVFSNDIVRLLFYGGAFGEKDVAITGKVLFFYGLGIIGIGIREIAIRIFYSKKETWAPILNSIIMVTVNIFLSFILSKYFGLFGLGLGTSLSLLFGAIVILFQLKRTFPALSLKRKGKNFGKILFSSCLMIATAYLSKGILSNHFSANLSLVFSIILGGLVYLGEIIIFRIDEFQEIKDRVSQIIQKR